MRLPPLAPAELTPNVRSMHDDMAQVIAKHLQGFVTQRSDGALIGPFSPMLHFPQFGGAAWTLVKLLISSAKLPSAAREVAVLLTGARLNSRYELYSHEHVAARSGLSEKQIATLSAGQRPADLSNEEEAAFDVTATLLQGRQLPESTYQRALRAFGAEQLAELVYLIGGYCLISLLLNAYDISVPGREENLPAS